MAHPDDKERQETQPKRGKPITIPVPKRGDFLANMEKVAPPVRREPDDPSAGRDDEGGAPEK